jgi:hypothetical protein
MHVHKYAWMCTHTLLLLPHNLTPVVKNPGYFHTYAHTHRIFPSESYSLNIAVTPFPDLFNLIFKITNIMAHTLFQWI